MVLVLSPGELHKRPRLHATHVWWLVLELSPEWKYSLRHERHMAEPSTLPDPMPTSTSQSRHDVDPESIANRPDVHLAHDDAPGADLRPGISMGEK